MFSYIFTMNKGDFVDAVANKLGSTKTDASDAIDAIFDVITKQLVEGGEVNVAGFGIFRAKQRKARQGVNPRTGEKIQIPAKMVPKFRPSKTLKDAVA